MSEDLGVRVLTLTAEVRDLQQRFAGMEQRLGALEGRFAAQEERLTTKPLDRRGRARRSAARERGR